MIERRKEITIKITSMRDLKEKDYSEWLGYLERVKKEFGQKIANIFDKEGRVYYSKNTVRFRLYCDGRDGYDLITLKRGKDIQDIDKWEIIKR
jgi:hypothetical protein